MRTEKTILGLALAFILPLFVLALATLSTKTASACNYGDSAQILSVRNYDYAPAQRLRITVDNNGRAANYVQRIYSPVVEQVVEVAPVYERVAVRECDALAFRLESNGGYARDNVRLQLNDYGRVRLQNRSYSSSAVRLQLNNDYGYASNQALRIEVNDRNRQRSRVALRSRERGRSRDRDRSRILGGNRSRTDIRIRQRS